MAWERASTDDCRYLSMAQSAGMIAFDGSCRRTGHFFVADGFALEQLHRNFHDLERCLAGIWRSNRSSAKISGIGRLPRDRGR